MAKVMIVDIGDKEFKFALDRKELVRAEKLGFNIRQIEDNPMTQISLFWTIGLHKLQPSLNENQCLELLDKYIEEDGDLTEVIEFLSQEYVAFLQTTQFDSKKSKKGRVETL